MYVHDIGSTYVMYVEHTATATAAATGGVRVCVCVCVLHRQRAHNTYFLSPVFPCLVPLQVWILLGEALALALLFALLEGWLQMALTVFVSLAAPQSH